MLFQRNPRHRHTVSAVLIAFLDDFDGKGDFFFKFIGTILHTVLKEQYMSIVANVGSIFCELKAHAISCAEHITSRFLDILPATVPPCAVR